jgi:predicted acyl esterase
MAQNREAEPKYKVAIEKNLAMRTRDGITLRADVYRPDASGRFPVLMMRTPYDTLRAINRRWSPDFVSDAPICPP